MFDFNSKTLDFWKKNIVISKKINLDNSLECFILISSNNATLADNILNKILDLIIDKIWKEDSYSDFSIALQNINSFLKTWYNDSENVTKINVLIWILDENNFLFSEVWKVSCYLIKNNNELLEVTDKKSSKKQFWYISSWELNHWETVVMWTHRLLNYLSDSDFVDGAKLDDLENFNRNIVDILKWEIIEKNLWITSIRYNKTVSKIKYNKLSGIKESLIKGLDNNFSKKLIAWYLVLKDKVNKSSKSIKNIVFTIWILVSFFLLYSIVLNIVWNNSYVEKKIEYTADLEKAKGFVIIATENINNQDLFDMNIRNAEDIIETISEKKLFLNDLNKMKSDIALLKKQFNWVELFDENSNNKIISHDYSSIVKTLKKDNKLYIISNDSISLLDAEKLKLEPFTFDKLKDDEFFIDATVLKNNIVLLTSESKIVTFSKWHFYFSDVNWQKTWENAKNIESFWNNIYLLWKDDNQIFKHVRAWTRFNSSIPYLKENDVKSIWKIQSIAIDGWIYALKEDLSMVKFFSSPKYRLETITLNKLPKNYNIEVTDGSIEIKTRPDLRYVYILLNNKVWIFKPNRKAYNDVTSLLYLWQIEWKNYSIIDFYPSHDREIVILNESGLYKMKFEIDEDDKLILR